MSKSKLQIDLEPVVMRELERRAKHEFLSVKDLVADILRRSAVMSRMRKYGAALHSGEKADPFIEYFSRAAPYRRKVKKKKQENGS